MVPQATRERGFGGEKSANPLDAGVPSREASSAEAHRTRPHGSMKKTTLGVGAVAVLAVASAAVWLVHRSSGSSDVSYRFAPVELGNIQQTVSATGSLSAVKTVQVGTQVSGQVSAIHADFNDRVTKGQLLAQIDPTLQQQVVRDATAQLGKAQAQLDQAQQEFDRNAPLAKQRFISASEFGTFQVNLSAAQADLKSAQVTLDKAKQNLSYTNILAPINGVVVERDVDVGQTVAASLSAPQIFLIAQDLAQMQILASVDESDISSIVQGQPVTFTVQAQPGRTFTGVVQQVRLESKLADNVVSYIVVVTLENADGKLLPGMTATTEFITGSATNVLMVPNSALRFRPTPDELAASGLPLTAAGSDSSGRGVTASAPAAATPARPVPAGTAGAPKTPRTGGGRAGPGSAGSVWTVDTGNKLKRIAVQVGLSDGQRTQVAGTGLAAGMQVITGQSLGGATPAPAAPSANPLTPQSTGGRRGGP
jgi:HlyD family secretion protein